MKEKSSKDTMEQVFQQLRNIQQVEPNADLYSAISNRLKQPDTISMNWIRAIAAVLLLFFSFEIILFKNDSNRSNSNELTSLIPQTQNLLYND
jgi:hypothetical protein